jgi:hypothetical protein
MAIAEIDDAPTTTVGSSPEIGGLSAPARHQPIG